MTVLLDADRFRTVVAATPLVSIDLIVRRADGAILLGERLNRPAQGCWFVPGGRIRKNESLDLAFSRLSEGELGRVFSRDRARLLGVYEHFYRDSVFGEQPDTHYVVLGYLIELGGGEDLEPPHEQHGRYRWSTPQQMRADEQVHPHSLAYLEALA